MYVDDRLSGPCSLQDSQELQSQLIHILDRGGMELHKCVSKSPGIIARHSYMRIRIQQKFTENFYKNYRKAMETIFESFYFQNQYQSEKCIFQKYHYRKFLKCMIL